MKRFLKHDRYELGDRDREALWHGIRRDLKSGNGSSVFRTVRLRPALGAALTVAALAILGVWWIDSNQTDNIVATHPGLLAENAPAPETRGKVEAPPANQPTDAPVFKTKAPGTEGMMDLDVAEVLQDKEAPPGDLAEEAADDPVAPAAKLPMAAAPAAHADMAVAKSAAGSALTGRVVDTATGQGLAYAHILIRGSSRSVAADSSGAFFLDNLPPGQEFTLVVMMPGYEPLEKTVSIPDQGSFEYAFHLKAQIMETGPAFDVADAAQRAEVKTVGEHRPPGTTTLNEKDEALRRQANEPGAGGPSVNSVAPAEEALRLSQKHADSWSSGGSVTGGTKPPNDEQVELMYFEHTGVNPFVATEDDSLSTFAVDVDNASWTVARNYLSRGMLPPADSIRVEEFVNAFDPGWSRHTDEVFRLHTDGAASRFGAGYHLLRVGVVGKTVADQNRKAANLIFVIDISGSMNRENRLGAVKKSLRILLDELGEGDRVGLVVYGSQGEVRLEPTDISRREVIMQAIDGLTSNGSTNVYEGLELAYRLARKYYEPAKVNRLILCSDGVANNGASTEAEKILSLVRRSSDEGITISTIGFGMGNYNDVMMEKLANKGDGNYYYVDRQDEAERVFRENLTGLLQTIAREVKVQVAFEADVVKRWRLLGYENRDVADRDFRNDAVDAGEIGAGHMVTALYEVKLDLPAGDSSDHADLQLGTFRLRHEAPTHDTARAGQVEEIEKPILVSDVTGDFAAGTVWMRAQAVAAEFAEILRGSFWAKESRLADLVPVADGLAAEMPGDPRVRDLAELIRRAADLQEGASADKEE